MVKKILIMILLMLMVMPFVSAQYNLISTTPISSEDLSFRDNSNNWVMQVKFNVSLPDSVTGINEAWSCFYLYSKLGTPASEVNVTYMLNDSWTDLSDVSFFSTQEGNVSYLVDFNDTTQNAYSCVNVTPIIEQVLLNEKQEVSIRYVLTQFIAGVLVAKADVLQLGKTSIFFIYEDSENAHSTGNYPYLLINYTASSINNIVITAPENDTYIGDVIDLEYYIDGPNPENLVNCSYNLTGNTTAVYYPFINTTMNTTEYGEQYVFFTCNCNDTGIPVTSNTVYFTNKAPCTEMWVESVSSCTDGAALVTYMDMAACGTLYNFTSLSPANNSYIDCSENSFNEGEYFIQYKSYPYVLLSDNPFYIYVELTIDGSKSIAPNLTVDFIDVDTSEVVQFEMSKNNVSDRYELNIVFNESDIDKNYVLYYHTDYAGVGTATGELYIRNITCNLVFSLYNDINKSEAYLNEFGYVIAKPIESVDYTVANYVLLTPIYDYFSNKYIALNDTDIFGDNYTVRSDAIRETADNWLYAEYVNGVANLTLYDSGLYEVRFIDGSFIFINNYGKILVENEGINVDLGTYDLNCNQVFTEYRDFFVSPYETGFLHNQGILGLIMFFILLSFGGGVAAMVLFKDLKIAGIIFIAILSSLLTVFLGINIFKLVL